jgi:hypothetical protein
MLGKGLADLLEAMVATVLGFGWTDLCLNCALVVRTTGRTSLQT